MKRRWLYAALSVIFVFTTAFILLRTSQNQGAGKEAAMSLLPRKEALAYANEWTLVQTNAKTLTEKIKKDPADLKSRMALTALYLQEARITGNFAYYNDAALEQIEWVLAKQSGNFEALSFKATVLLSQHQFEKAYETARKLCDLFPYNAYVRGLLLDAAVELGHYEEALDAAEQMISIRPDIRSYSRIGYLREIHGDLPGAIEAMQLAIDAGAPGDENTEWCRVQTARLYEKLGQATTADTLYRISLANRENYPYALAGLAGLAADAGDYSKALALYEKADSLIPDHLFREGIVEIYELTGQKEKAEKTAKEILRYMQQFSSEKRKDPFTGQNEGHELAHAWMGVGDYEKALHYALQEQQRRPANIEVNETMAIIYYLTKEYAKALPYIETALQTNCKNPELLCHAGLIYAKNGRKREATLLLQAALKNNPLIPAALEKESREVLASL